MDILSVKSWVFDRTVAELEGFGIKIVAEHSELNKPWGSYLRIAEESVPQFYSAYWNGIEVPSPSPSLKLDPKILIVQPGMPLSLQYHHRRREHWRVLDGPVKIVIGTDNNNLESRVYNPGDVIRLTCGEWHRLVGMDSWGKIAEIWEHVDASNPSDENDIVRVEDMFGR